MTLTPADHLALARAHQQTESAGDFDGILATMGAAPVYEFYPLGVRFTGLDATRRYYRHFVDTFRLTVHASEPIGEWQGATGLVTEYDILLKQDHGEPTRHRISAVLVYGPDGEDGLAGERMFADETLIRAMLGPVWDEVEPL
jgi:hypothetical protein